MLNTAASKKKKTLDLWDKIEIVVERDGETGLYITRVEDIGPSRIVASKPEYVKGNRLLADNIRVYVQFRKPDAMYRFPAKIVSVPGSSSGAVELFPLQNMQRVQRRNFVRIDRKIDLKFSRLKVGDGNRRLLEACWRDSYSKNISAGGMLMWVGDNIEVGDILMIRIGDYDSMGLPRLMTALCCRIVRISEKRFAGVEFIKRENLSRHFHARELARLPGQIGQFDNHIQNNMVRFIFEEQVRERQKGLI
ncbi:MAG: hypothetical protein DRP46_03745 [Candidatus Zixiibacteriota bacterium]|nr:MAG: hypothetical protein DRP46_03745 [candidate division Zixibacteria bacterium]